MTNTGLRSAPYMRVSKTRIADAWEKTYDQGHVVWSATKRNPIHKRTENRRRNKAARAARRANRR